MEMKEKIVAQLNYQDLYEMKWQVHYLVRVCWAWLLMQHLSQAVTNDKKGTLLPENDVVNVVKN